MEQMRINKFLSGSGYCSRREADRLVEAGQVTIDGHIALMGSKVGEGQTVCVSGKKIELDNDTIILCVNKPVGIVCTTTDKYGKNNIVDFVGYSKRIYPVGRLDKDSQGLILMTNNGDIMDKILRAANGHEKEYIVEVDKDIDDEFIRKMSGGLYLSELDRTTKPCFVHKEGKRKFRIILTQGLNRQIRRMCHELGKNVVSLKRIRIMNILLGDLKLGSYRKITDKEYKDLIKMINQDDKRK